MNSRLAVRLLASTALCASTYAANFWDKKPYQEWNDQEIARILIDSPWAKEVLIRVGQDYVAPPPAAPNPASVAGVGGPTPNLGGGPLGPAVGRKVQTIPSGATVRVRWESAEPLRQAIARTLYKAGSAEAQELVSSQPSHYIIAIDNIPPYLESARFGSLQADVLSNAVLKVGKRTVIRATNVTVSANKAGLIVRLEFPRDPEIREKDDEVTLQTEAGITGVTCTFRLRDMIFGGKFVL